MKGDGTIYKRGKVWWMKFYRDGRAVSMSAETTVKDTAKDRLREEVQKARSSQWLDPKQRQVTVGDLVDDLFKWYRTTQNIGGDSLHNAEAGWNNHTKTLFEHIRAESFGTVHQREYRAKRMEEGAAPATVNRELQTVRGAFKLAFRSEPPKVLRVPYFEMTKLNNARKVFIDEPTMDKLRTAAAKLGLWQRIALEIAFTYGWRKGELLRLHVRDVNLAQRLLRLEDSKNGEPREVPIPDHLYVLLQAYVTGKSAEQKIVPVSSGAWRHTWKAICDLAGVKSGKKDGGVVLHDARRSSARNKSAAGVSSRVIMQMQGWKSEAMFRRYAIVDQSDMRQALIMEQKQRETNARSNEQLQYSYNQPRTDA